MLMMEMRPSRPLKQKPAASHLQTVEQILLALFQLRAPIPQCREAYQLWRSLRQTEEYASAVQEGPTFKPKGVHFHTAKYVFQHHLTDSSSTSPQSSDQPGEQPMMWLVLCVHILLVDAPKDFSPSSLRLTSLLLVLQSLAALSQLWRSGAAVRDWGELGTFSEWLLGTQESQDHSRLQGELAERSPVVPTQLHALAFGTLLRLAAHRSTTPLFVIQGVGYCLSARHGRMIRVHSEFFQGITDSSNVEKPASTQMLSHVIGGWWANEDESVIHSLAESYMEFIKDVEKQEEGCAAAQMIKSAVTAPITFARTDVSACVTSLADWFSLLLMKSLLLRRESHARSSRDLWPQKSMRVSEAMRILCGWQRQHSVDGNDSFWCSVLEGMRLEVFYPSRLEKGEEAVLESLVLSFYTTRQWRQSSIDLFVALLCELGKLELLKGVFEVVKKHKRGQRREPAHHGDQRQFLKLSPQSCALILSHVRQDSDWTSDVVEYMHEILSTPGVDMAETQYWKEWLRSFESHD